ncbi:iron ABC transporter permease [Mesorhizobium loti]|nr:iron ABC transporter permease [Mesorhizobium loti]PLP55860.1 iron ABC transporter permease [Mesorhizobium loti]
MTAIIDGSSQDARPRISGAGRRYRDPLWLLSLVMVVIVGCLVLPPFVALVRNSLFETLPDGSSGAFTLENFARLAANGHFLQSTINSVVFALLSTVLAILMGGSLAWIVERTNAPFRDLAYLMTVVSLSIPGVIYVPAWLFFLGPTGPLNDLYRLAGGSGLLFNVNSMTGMVIIEGFGWIPLTFLLFAASFRMANAELEEAARMSGANVFEMMRRVSIPLAAPAAFAAALFIFIRSLQAFDIPKLVGTGAGIKLLTTDIYDSIRTVPPQIGYASAFSVALTIVVAGLLYLYSRLAMNASRFATVTGKGYKPRPLALGWARWVCGGIVLLNVLIVLVLPLLMLLWVAVTPFIRPVRWSAFSSLTSDNFALVLTDDRYLELVTNTLIVSASAATVTMLLMVICGWLVARRRAYHTALDQMIALPMLIPSIVLSVAMMDLALRSPIPLYSTLTIVVIAFVVHYLPFGMRYTFTGSLQLHKELEESAGVCGATPLGMLRRIVVPLLMPSIVAGWLFVFLNASRDLSTAIILAGPDTKTIAVAIFDQAINGQFSEVAALGLLWSAMMSIVAMIFYFLVQRRSSGGGISF